MTEQSKHPRKSIQLVEPLDKPSSSSITSDPEASLLSSSEEPAKTAFRPRSNSHHLHPSQPSPPRWWLRMQATFWRTLMNGSMFLHDWAPPRPPLPAFTRSIPTTYDGPHSPPIILYFYIPPDYFTRIESGHRYPVVINYHGGGFCLGSALDDRYWAAVVLQHTPAIFISIDYRLAPEYPFPTPVDDSVDALLYLASHSTDLGIDPSRIALSGFSAGANLAFSVPLRLKFHHLKYLSTNQEPPPPDMTARWATSTLPLLQSLPPAFNIVNITSFYPLLDWTLSRPSKRRTSRRPSKTLPAYLSNLFDYSYLPPPDLANLHASPFVSPGLAPDYMLQEGLPDDIGLYLCEWDMLLREGEVFAERLRGVGKKRVRMKMVDGVVHGWDKHPDPWRDQGMIDALYGEACGGLRESFGVGERGGMI